MNIFQRLWAMLVYTWYQVSGKDDAQYQSSAEDVVKPAPAAKPAPAVESAPAVKSVDPQDPRLQAMIARITANAERYETDQRAMMVAFDGDRELFVQAAYQVDWPAVLETYAPSTISRIMGTGTNFNFKGHTDLKGQIYKALNAESARRSPPPPKNHGMGGETPSQPSGYVRKAGAGGGLHSWVWVRKDRAAEEQAIREFQAKLDSQA